jgi:hypothetical protein
MDVITRRPKPERKEEEIEKYNIKNITKQLKEILCNVQNA